MDAHAEREIAVRGEKTGLEMKEVRTTTIMMWTHRESAIVPGRFLSSCEHCKDVSHHTIIYLGENVLDTAEEAITFHAKNVKRTHSKNQFVSHTFSYIEKKHNKMQYKYCWRLKKKTRTPFVVNYEYFQILFLFFSWFLVILLYFFYSCMFSSTSVSLLFQFVNPCKLPVPVAVRSAAARLLRLWVRIPPGAWMFVLIVVCCQVEVFATSRSLVQRSPIDCGASLCVI